GSIMTKGQIIGPKNNPKINANLQLTNVETNNTRIGSLASDIKLNLAANEASHINLRVTKIHIHDYLIDALNINGIITTSKQAINIKSFAAIDIPGLNLNLKNIRFMLAKDSNRLIYSAHFVSGPGKLDVSGETALNKANLASKINIIGANFLASNTENMQLYISPDLKLDFTTDKLEAKGTIKIPKANIQPSDLTGVATLPNDVVFVDKQHQQLLIKKQTLKVYANINLVLGDQVMINAFNIEGRLNGQMRIYENPNNTTASGA
ncbi:unnamed protein product, partial [marine sediment metagenome]